MLTLKKFNAENLPSGKGQRDIKPRLTIQSNGTIRINKAAIQHLVIKPGDRIAFWQNEKEPQEWYMGKDESGILITGSVQKNQVYIKSKKLVQMLRESLGSNLNQDEVMHMHISTEVTLHENGIFGLIGPIKKS